MSENTKENIQLVINSSISTYKFRYFKGVAFNNWGINWGIRILLKTLNMNAFNDLIGISGVDSGNRTYIITASRMTSGLVLK